MAEFAALPLFTDALLSDTLHLSDAEMGLYMRLLVLLWRSPECRIPNDKAWIAKRLGRSPLQYDSDIAPIIAEFCVTSGNYIFQKRLLKEFEYTREKKAKSKNAAQARWGNQNAEKRGETPKNADVPSVPDKPLEYNDLQLCLDDAPTPTPTPSFKKERERETGSAVTITDDFEKWFQEKFWDPYPKARAGDKEAAKRAMKKALTKTKKEEIEDGVTRYAASSEVARGFAKGAAAWLNDSRWTSEYVPAPRGSGGKRPNQKASGMDKILRTAELARKMRQEQLDTDRDAPWNKDDKPEAGGDSGEILSIGAPLPD